METTCPFCGCDAAAHDPVTVLDGAGRDAPAAGVFCNYACLTAYVDEAGLADGSFCRLDA